VKSHKRLSPSNLRWLFVIVVCLAAAAAFSLRPTMAQVTNQSAANQATLPGHPPELVLDGTAQLGAPFASAQKLRLVIGLQPPHMAEEQKFLEDVQNRDSPQFHRFLTADQWNQRFAPSVKDEQAVVDWATSQGLTVTNRYPNRLLVDVEAPVSVIQDAFAVRISSYKIKSEAFFSNDQPPTIPPALSGIVHSLEGLNNLERMHGSMKGAGNISNPVYVPGQVVAQGESVHSDGDPKKLPASMASLRKSASRGSEITSVPNITNGLYDPSDIYGSNAYDYNALQALGHCCNPLGKAGSSPPESSIALAT
jgi:subtilase family serine protease